MSKSDRLQGMIALITIASISIGYVVFGEGGIFLAGSVLLMIVACASLYFLIADKLPRKKPKIKHTVGQLHINVRCSDYNILRPLVYLTLDGEPIGGIYRGCMLSIDANEGSTLGANYKGDIPSVFTITNDCSSVYIYTDTNLTLQLVNESAEDVSVLEKISKAEYEKRHRSANSLSVTFFILSAIFSLVFLVRSGLM